PALGSPTYERDYNKVIEKLNKNQWSALYVESPGLSDLDVFRFGAWLSFHVRNFDEFAELFKDSGQDAGTWDTTPDGGWDKAIWKVRVGRYETSGENHVEESWEPHEKLTKLMNAYVPTLISNTEQLLKARNLGKSVDSGTADRFGTLDRESLPNDKIPAHLRP